MNQRLKLLTLATGPTECLVTFFLLLILVPNSPTLFAQAPANSAAEAQSIQQLARSAVFGANPPTAIVLDGTFTSKAGLLQQSGNAHLTVNSDGSYLVSLSGSAGPAGESRTVTDGLPSCTWTDQDGAIHQSLFLNCLPPAWFFPSLSLLTSGGDASVPEWAPSSYTSDSLGNHLRFQFSLSTADANQQDPHLSKPVDLVLDPATKLPSYALYTVHPDTRGLNTDIPVQIAYSNYKSISGVMVPFHIQRYLNGSLVLDLEIASASVR